MQQFAPRAQEAGKAHWALRLATRATALGFAPRKSNRGLGKRRRSGDGCIRSTVIANPYTYTGRRLDDETGLYYYRHRYYHAQLGRFVSRDPIGYEAGETNLYCYVTARPTYYVDPSGLVWWNPFTWLDVNWDEAIDREVDLVGQLNDAFATNHSFLYQFSAEERKRIENALGIHIEWGKNSPFLVSGESYEERDKVLQGSQTSLYVAGAADALAAGFALAGVNPVICGAGAATVAGSGGGMATTCTVGGATADVVVTGNVAHVTVTIQSGLTTGFVHAVKQCVIKAGATSAVVNTSLTLNPALAQKLSQLAAKGGAYCGGRVVQVAGGPCPIFHIIFDKL